MQRLPEDGKDFEVAFHINVYLILISEDVHVFRYIQKEYKFNYIHHTCCIVSFSVPKTQAADYQSSAKRARAVL